MSSTEKLIGLYCSALVAAVSVMFAFRDGKKVGADMPASDNRAEAQE